MQIKEKIFDQEEVNNAIEAFQTIHIEPLQRKIIEAFGSVLHKTLPLDELPLRGFALMGIREWQVNHKQAAANIDKMSPVDRIKAVSEMSDSVEKLLLKKLRLQDYAKNINEGIATFMNMYSKTYAQR